MPLVEVVYASRLSGFDRSVLSNILRDARRDTAREGITGALAAP